jgi:O-antigen/teichoic acid export membrane protein
MSLAGRTRAGIAWAYSAFVAQRILGFVTTTVLARILFPQDFGLIAFALLVVGLIDALRDFGLKDAVIYASDPVGDAADTAFLMNIGIGVAQFAIVMLLAPLGALAIGDPRIVDVLRILAFAFPVNALGLTHEALLQKGMEFRRWYGADIAVAIVKTAVILMLAFVGAGIWSLVIGQLVGSVCRTVARWLQLEWTPRWRFVRSQAKMLLGYSVYIFSVRIFDIILERVDQLLIAVLIGQVELAFYYLATRIAEIVVANFNLVLAQVLYPAYASIKDDQYRLTKAYGEATKYTAFVVVPAGLGLAAVAPELVRVVFGARWEPCIELVQILSLAGIAMSLPWTAGDLFKAIGRPDIPAKLVLFEAAYSIPLILFFGFTWRQAFWIAIGYLISVSIMAAIRFWLVRRFLALSRWFYIRMIWVPFAASVVMFVVVTLMRQMMAAWPHSAILVCSIVVGATIYGTLVWLLARDDMHHFWENLRLLLLPEPSRRFST